MPIIRPSSDLRNKYNEISKICHETNKPVYITKNGQDDLVILSNEAYEKYEEKRLNILIEEQFDKRYSDFEEFKKDILKNIELALKDIEEGKYMPMENALNEMEAKYGISKPKEI